MLFLKEVVLKISEMNNNYLIIINIIISYLLFFFIFNVQFFFSIYNIFIPILKFPTTLLSFIIFS